MGVDVGENIEFSIQTVSVGQQFDDNYKLHTSLKIYTVYKSFDFRVFMNIFYHELIFRRNTT